jgi:stress-induced morphogen
MILPDEVRARLVRAFPDAEIDLTDLTGTQDHYGARVVTAAFEGKSMIEQHQLVYGALADVMDGPIHALKLQTFTPRAWHESNRGP